MFDTTCLAVEVEVEKSLLDADFMSIGIAVAIGLIVGGLLMLVCAKLCLKDIAKKRVRTSSLVNPNNNAEMCRPTHAANTKHLYNIYTMLDQRRRRWADVVYMLYKCFVFSGYRPTPYWSLNGYNFNSKSPCLNVLLAFSLYLNTFIMLWIYDYDHVFKLLIISVRELTFFVRISCLKSIPQCF